MPNDDIRELISDENFDFKLERLKISYTIENWPNYYFGSVKSTSGAKLAVAQICKFLGSGDLAVENLGL